jgi:hypothetical protein
MEQSMSDNPPSRTIREIISARLEQDADFREAADRLRCCGQALAAAIGNSRIPERMRRLEVEQQRCFQELSQAIAESLESTREQLAADGFFIDPADMDDWAHLARCVASGNGFDPLTLSPADIMNWVRAKVEMEKRQARTLAASLKPAAEESQDSICVPKFDLGTRTLSIGGEIVHDYGRRTAGSQEAILELFEKAGWPRILKVSGDEADALRDTIRNMNNTISRRGKIKPLIDFHLSVSPSGDDGVRWETAR